MSIDVKGRAFDGIICLGGEDWWYHNRGHFDFQIMGRIARRWPVLLVNSLGVRMPSLEQGSLFAARIGRKLESLSRGVVNVENAFWVCSPLALPGQAGSTLMGWALAPQIRLAAWRAGIRNPVLWVHCPAGAPLMDKLNPAAVVMQRTDRFEAFPEGDRALLGRQIDAIRAQADLVVYAAPHLRDEERSRVRRSALVTHGVDLEVFLAAGAGRTPEPGDMAAIPRPRIGFVGGIDAHTFDPELFLGLAARLPYASFVMVGGSSLPAGWCPYPNVHFLGRKPYDGIAGYMAAMDVLIMPWNESEWIKASCPVKLKEYLATGRPVVSTDFPALDGWRDAVRVAKGVEEFSEAVRMAIGAGRMGSEALQSRLASESWDAKADLVMDEILKLGLVFAPDPRAALRVAGESAGAVRTLSGQQSS